METIELHLTATEKWVLSYADYLDKATPSPGVPDVRKDWKPAEYPIKASGMPTTYDELEKAAEALNRFNLLRLDFDSGGFGMRLTGPGLAYLRNLDNPDYIEQWTKWTHRHPWAAAIIVGFTFLGSAAGLVSLLWNIFGTHKARP